MPVTTMNKSEPCDKLFLGQVLKESPNLNQVWMNDGDPGKPFVCISHRKTWTVAVGLAGHKFEGRGSTEQEARNDFTNQLASLRQTIVQLEQWSEKG